MSTIMHDALGIAPHVVEAVLNHVSAHKLGVAGVYNRARYEAQKRHCSHAAHKRARTRSSKVMLDNSFVEDNDDFCRLRRPILVDSCQR